LSAKCEAKKNRRRGVGEDEERGRGEARAGGGKANFEPKRVRREPARNELNE
jgi:hypothetical protein